MKPEGLDLYSETFQFVQDIENGKYDQYIKKEDKKD